MFRPKRNIKCREIRFCGDFEGINPTLRTSWLPYARMMAVAMGLVFSVCVDSKADVPDTG